VVSERECDADVRNRRSDQPARQNIRSRNAGFDGGAHQIITITLNLTNSVKTGMIPTAMDVPMDATAGKNQRQGQRRQKR